MFVWGPDLELEEVGEVCLPGAFLVVFRLFYLRICWLCRLIAAARPGWLQRAGLLSGFGAQSSRGGASLVAERR